MNNPIFIFSLDSTIECLFDYYFFINYNFHKSTSEFCFFFFFLRVECGRVLKPKSRRNLTIRQRQHPRKRQWKIDLATFQTISRLSKAAMLLKRREFRSELKRGYRARVQTGMVEFIVLPFPFSICRSCAGTEKKCTKKRATRAELLFCPLNLLFLWRCFCRRRRSCPFHKRSLTFLTCYLECFYKKRENRNPG